MTETRPTPPYLTGSLNSLERVVSGIAARFVNISPADVDRAILDSQREIVNALDADRSSLLQVDDQGELVFTHVWTRPEWDMPLPQLPQAVTALFPWAMARLRAGEELVLDRVEEMTSRIDLESYRRFGVKSTVGLPLFRGREFIGALTFGSMRHERPATAALLDAMRLVATVFAQALQQRRSHEALQASLAEVSRLRQLLTRDNELLHLEVNALRPSMAVSRESAAMRDLMALVDDVAPTRATVLLLGETGTGKDVIAKEIHRRSPRHKRPMVSINCGALPDALIESELFGRERGAYTGAISRQMGRFEMADGSTIFLDEIADLPLAAQVKLLRVVEDHVVDRLGGSGPQKVDVRIIAATNASLEAAVIAGTFREDLYYRLNVFPLTVPALRDRPEDIPTLVWAFVEEFASRFNKQVTSVTRESMDALARHTWPGNVRELRNVVEHAMILSRGPQLHIAPPATRGAAPAPASMKLADVESSHILSVLQRANWRVRGAGGAADLLGLKPTTLEGRMARLGLRRP